MKNKLAMIISIVMTTILITIGIGVIRNVNADNAQAVVIPTATTAQTNNREVVYLILKGLTNRFTN